MIDNEALLKRAEVYAKSRGMKILRKDFLGHGSDGAVWSTDRKSAVKVIERRDSYLVELESYRTSSAQKHHQDLRLQRSRA